MVAKGRMGPAGGMFDMPDLKRPKTEEQRRFRWRKKWVRTNQLKSGYCSILKGYRV